ncbi:Sodium/calcium exchanger protein-domain-containing protein [Panaeolus papilionaceus]|nr:Sodium/calcium exchanger protein-domain-containing protein [Panaeolus papilionaceus]
MGESFALPSHNVSNNVLPQPTLALAAEDDDEPPSSGPRNDRPSQMRNDSESSNPSTVSGTVHRKDYATQEKTTVEHEMKADRKTDEVVLTTTVRPGTDVEKLEIVTDDVPVRRRRRFRFIKLSRSARLRALFTPRHELGPDPTYAQSFMNILRYTPLNLLLAFIPVSWALHFSHQSPTLTFIFSGLGIIPLAALLGLGTEQIALRTSQSVGGLLNASLGNLIEMIISGIALKQCELEVVQSALLGGLLSNLLLVLGCAFIVGGFRFSSQQFQPMVAQLNSSLLILSVISLTIPAAFHQYLESRLTSGTELDILLKLSRGSAIILIFIYISYLFFQFYSHNHLFLDTVQEVDVVTSSRSNSPSSGSLTRRSTQATLPTADLTHVDADTESSCSSCSSNSSDIETPKLNKYTSLGLVIVITALAYVTAEGLIGSLEGLIEANPGISKEFITLIVIPILSNAAEHTTAVVVARKGKFDLAMSVAVGSCIQIALFVIPVLVLVAWGMAKPLTLLFDPLETVVLFFSVLVVKFSVEDGKSHWMSGLLLMGTYTLIALAFWYFPSDTLRLIQGQVIKCN